MAVVDIADDIIAVREFEDAGKRRKRKPAERRKFGFESEKRMRVITEHEACAFVHRRPFSVDAPEAQEDFIVEETRRHLRIDSETERTVVAPAFKTVCR